MPRKTVRRHPNGQSWLVTVGNKTIATQALPVALSDFDTIEVEDDGTMNCKHKGEKHTPDKKLEKDIAAFLDEYVTLSNASETVVPKVDDLGRYIGLVHHDTAGIRVTCEPPSQDYTWDFEREMWVPNQE